MRAAIGADAHADIGAGEHARRVGGVHGQAAHRAVEFDRLLQAEPVPAGAVVDAAQDALAGGCDKNGSLHGACLLVTMVFQM